MRDNANEGTQQVRTIFGGSPEVDADAMFTHAMAIAKTESVAFHNHKWGERCADPLKEVSALTEPVMEQMEVGTEILWVQTKVKPSVNKSICWAYIRPVPKTVDVELP